MVLAIPLRGVSSKLINKFGGEMTFRSVVNGTYNTTTGTTAETVTDTVVQGVLQDVRKQEVGGMVQAGDKMLMLAAADLPAIPTISDRIVINTRSLQIIQITTIEQDNTEIVYEIILRD